MQRVPSLPKMKDLDKELLYTTLYQKWILLLRPFYCLFTWGFAIWAGLWWIALLVMVLVFISIAAVAHDLVHNNLGLTKRQTDWWLFITGVLILHSGHAYRITHLHHHQAFPENKDDPEGDPARMSFWQAVCHGPFFLPALWRWAWKNTEGDFEQRCWIAIEIGLAFLMLTSGIILLYWSIIPFLYVMSGILYGWGYSLLAVHLQRSDDGETVFEQSKTLRGPIVPRLFLGLTYHLEHHLYPNIPGHNLPELSDQLEPIFKDNEVEFRRLI